MNYLPVPHLFTLWQGTGSLYLISEKNSSADLGPVVQSIVSLTSSLRGQLIKCFTIL